MEDLKRVLDPVMVVLLPLPYFIIKELDGSRKLHYRLRESPAASAIASRQYSEVVESFPQKLPPSIRHLAFSNFDLGLLTYVCSVISLNLSTLVLQALHCLSRAR